MRVLDVAEPAVDTAKKDKGAELADISSQVLFAGRREVVIVHAEQIYRLSITRQNKLILTK